MFSGSRLTHKRFPSPLKSCIIATALPLLLFLRFRLVYAEPCLIKFMLFLLLQIADFQCQMTCSKQGQAATGGTGDGEMEFPFACERLCDIKSNLSHLPYCSPPGCAPNRCQLCLLIVAANLRSKTSYLCSATTNNNNGPSLSWWCLLVKNIAPPPPVLLFFINRLQSNA